MTQQPSITPKNSFHFEWQLNHPCSSQTLQDIITINDLNSFEKTNLLVEVDKKLPNDEYPLSFAIRIQNNDVAKELFKLGANPALKDDMGLSAYDYALLNKNHEMLLVLFSSQVNSEITTLDYEIESGFPKKSHHQISELFSHLKKNQQLPILQALIKTNNALELDDYLSDVDNLSQIKNIQPGCFSIVHYTALMGTSDALELFISYNIAVNFPDQYGRTPLHYAAINNDQKCFETLLRKDNNIHSRDINGATPIGILATDIQSRDPLNISYSQAMLFCLNIVFTALQFSLCNFDLPVITNAQSLTLLGNLNTASTISELVYFFSSCDQTWKQALTLLSFLAFNSVPLLKLPLLALMSTRLFYDLKTFMSLNYKNAQVRPLATLGKFSVLATNNLVGLHHLISSAAQDIINLPKNYDNYKKLAEGIYGLNFSQVQKAFKYLKHTT